MSQPSPQGQTMCSSSWLLSMWGPANSLPRKIFGLFLTGALNANTYTYSVGEEWSHAPGQSRQWTNVTAQKHPVKFIFIFGPSSPVSLSRVAIQAVTHAKTQNFHTCRLALNRIRHPNGSNACPRGATICTVLPGYPTATTCQPQLCWGQLALTLLPCSWLPNRRGPLPPRWWNVAFAVDVSHLLTEPHLGEQHRVVQSKCSLTWRRDSALETVYQILLLRPFAS